MSLSLPYHGSTALEGVLMSSRNLATLCPFDGWQCEGREIMSALGFGKGSTGVKTWNFQTMLDEYSKYWDLKRPVLFEKSPNEMLEVPHVRHQLMSTKLPSRMAAAGITTLKRAYVLLWRPVCLSNISSHALGDIDDFGAVDYASREKVNLRRMVLMHKFLQKKG